MKTVEAFKSLSVEAWENPAPAALPLQRFNDLTI